MHGSLAYCARLKLSIRMVVAISAATLLPLAGTVQAQIGGGGGGNGGGNGNGTGNGNGATREERAQQVIDTLQSTIVPDVWDVNGGRATIKYINGVLVVTAPVRIHGLFRK